MEICQSERHGEANDLADTAVDRLPCPVAARKVGNDFGALFSSVKNDVFFVAVLSAGIHVPFWRLKFNTLIHRKPALNHFFNRNFRNKKLERFRSRPARRIGSERQPGCLRAVCCPLFCSPSTSMTSTSTFKSSSFPCLPMMPLPGPFSLVANRTSSNTIYDPP